MLKFEKPKQQFTHKNGQFSIFSKNIRDEKEKNAMNDFGLEVIEATKDESVVNLHKLNLADWAANGASEEIVKKNEKL